MGRDIIVVKTDRVYNDEGRDALRKKIAGDLDLPLNCILVVGATDGVDFLRDLNLPPTMEQMAKQCEEFHALRKAGGHG